MKYFYEILISIIIIIALLTFIFKSYLIAVSGILLFFVGCIFEYIFNRNSNP